MQAGGLNEILRALLDNSDDNDISKLELMSLLQKIQNDATEIYNTKYGSDEMIKFNIDNNSYAYDSRNNLIGKQSVKSLECIRKAIKKNLELMHENMKTIFQSYLTRCGDGGSENSQTVCR